MTKLIFMKTKHFKQNLLIMYVTRKHHLRAKMRFLSPYILSQNKYITVHS